MNPKLLSAFSLLFISPVTAVAETEAPVQSTVLVQGSHSWDGAGFGYPAGEAEITVTRIDMKAGSSLPLHCHPVPLAGAVVKGSLEVRKENGEKTVIRPGEGLIEVSGQWHYGHALDDVEILVVYAGAKDVPTTILKNGDPQWVAACR